MQESSEQEDAQVGFKRMFTTLFAQYCAAEQRRVHLATEKGCSETVSAGFGRLLHAIDAAVEEEVAEDIDLDECPDEFLVSRHCT